MLLSVVYGKSRFELVPEPTTILFLSFGSIFLRKRGRK
ncbi:MAG: PEP-CTERM sorting domain-containing protein [Planctomycetota bacterium]